MRHLDLFSGIGGFALACRMVGGIETIGFVELDLYCQFVLKKNFPGVPIHDDIKTFRGDEYGAVDIITGGFPCQPFSCAGLRRGSEDDRHLWPEMLRVIKEAKPTWVLGENVPGIIKMELERVLSDLEIEGYTVQTIVIPAYAVDAKHRRDRVWILGHSNSQPSRGNNRAKSERARVEVGGEVLEDKGGGEKINVLNSSSDDVANPYCQRKSQQARQQQECGNGIEFGGKDVSDSNGKHVHHAGYGSSENLKQGKGKIQRGNNGWCEWESEPEVGRVVDGLSCRLDRVRALGNAIVPQVAAEIIHGIKKVGGGER